MAMAAQERVGNKHAQDSTDIFFRHMDLDEVTVTGVTGETKLKHATAPVSVIRQRELRSTSSANIIDAISLQPGVSQLTTGGSISKPIIRGLGYNRVVVMSEGVRQEGQQWGDEHGVEADGSTVGSVEILKGPASLMYGSDAMAGVVILHPQTLPAEGEMQANASTEYQTNNGLFHYSLSMAGNQKGFVWDASYSDKMAHAYKNKYDGYVPGSQYRQRAGRLRLGLSKQWGHTWLTWTAFHLTPSIVEGERNASTGELEHEEGWTGHQYGKTLPFQQVKHYKLVWDNALNIGDGQLKAVVGYQQNRRQEFEGHDDEEEPHDGHGHAAELEPGLFLKLHTLTYDLRYLTGEWKGWRMSAGVQGMYQQSDNKGEEYLIPDSRLFDMGLYATASKSLGESWTVSGGLRYDHRRLHGYSLVEDGEERFADFTRHFNGVTGSVGAVWNLGEQWNLRMNVARGFRTPNMSELASNGVHEGSLRYEIGSRQLKAEYSLQTDLGIDFTSSILSAQLALFANRIDNFIFTHRTDEVADPDYMTFAYTQGDACLMGFEAGLDLHPIHSLHFQNTFSFVDARLLHHGDDGMRYLPFTPAPRWTSEVKWELAHHAHSTISHRHGRHDGGSHHSHYRDGRLSLNNLYLSAATECYLRQSHVRSVDATETVTPGYMLLNLSAGTDLHIGKRKIAELYVTADNLLNRAYQNHLSRLKYADVNAVTGRQGVYNMGRNITFKVVVPIVL